MLLYVRRDRHGVAFDQKSYRLQVEKPNTISHDRLVWTDNDFHHPLDWLATLSADYEKYAPVSEVPYFVGQDPLSIVLEPLYASAGSLGIYLGNQIWGGAVIFERDDIDEVAFLDELRRTVSDDGLLREYLYMMAVICSGLS